MSQKTPPTYSPPTPVLAMSGQQGTQQGIDMANQYFGPQMGAQAQGINDINQGAAYYNNFGPSTLAEAVGNQYMKNVIPQATGAAMNQLANSGMAYSPTAAATVGNITGNIGVQVGQYEQGISNQNATNNLGQLMSINPNSYYLPITQNILGQSNINTQEQNQYNQALAQQQYQQAYNKYAQQNAMAATLGQISPIGGQIYGASNGTSGSAFGGSAQSLSQMAPAMMSAGMGGFGGTGSTGSGLDLTSANGAQNMASANGVQSGYGSGTPTISGVYANTGRSVTSM